MYLITKWFGAFLCDNKRVKNKILFSNNEKEISKKLLKIEKKEILAEEKKISKGEDVIVNEKRLQKIGKYRPSDPFFKKINILPEDFGFSEEILHKASLIITKKQVEKKLASEDLQIVQMVNALDDLIHTSNLLSERLDSWSILPEYKKKIKPLQSAFSTINNEILNLEKQIEQDMEKLAPNTTCIVGPLIGARLISLAGSMQRLSIMPASTIQILGAEKALFRHKKEGSRPPKHGIIFQQSAINKAPYHLRGKIARVLANKLSIAIKADVFTKRDISDELLEDFNKRVKEIRKQ